MCLLGVCWGAGRDRGGQDGQIVPPLGVFCIYFYSNPVPAVEVVVVSTHSSSSLTSSRGLEHMSM